MNMNQQSFIGLHCVNGTTATNFDSFSVEHITENI